MKNVLMIALILCANVSCFLCGYAIGKHKVYKHWSDWLDIMSEIMKKPEE